MGGTVGTPTGWVQVRETQIEGTRLNFRGDLRVDRAWTGEFAVRYLRGRNTLRFVVQSYALDGTTTLPGDVRFNGATLAGGTPLATRTRFPWFFRATLTRERDLAAMGGGRVSAIAGLTFVALTFRLRGTLSPATVGRETREDFVTQELPVPLIGLAFAHPVTGRLATEASADMGYLPWVNSLRHEGGVVRLRQHHLDLALNVTCILASALRADVGYRYSSFTQHEDSREDGNDITFAQSGMYAGLAYRL